MSQEHIHRVTLFKIPEVEDQNKLLAKYKVAQQKALKVPCSRFPGCAASNIRQNGDPYIIRVEAGQTEEDQRNQGYTVCAKTTFASMDDFEYYDKTCEAHKEIRAFAASVNKGSMMVFFKSVVT